MKVSVSGIYHKGIREEKDELLKSKIEGVLEKHPSYGHKRIAIELKKNKKAILRVMNKYGIKPYRRRKKPRKRADEKKAECIYKNLIKDICPIKEGVVWVEDFTYIWYKDHFVYLSTVMDIYTREIVGYSISRNHDQQLIISSLLDALSKNKGSVKKLCVNVV